MCVSQGTAGRMLLRWHNKDKTLGVVIWKTCSNTAALALCTLLNPNVLDKALKRSCSGVVPPAMPLPQHTQRRQCDTQRACDAVAPSQSAPERRAADDVVHGIDDIDDEVAVYRERGQPVNALRGDNLGNLGDQRTSTKVCGGGAVRNRGESFR